MGNFGIFIYLVVLTTYSQTLKKRVKESEIWQASSLDFIFGVDVSSVRTKESILNTKLFMRIKQFMVKLIKIGTIL